MSAILAPLKPRDAGIESKASAAARWADFVERIAILALYTWLVLRLFRGYQADGNLTNLLLVPCEGLIVVFMLIRRRPQVISGIPSHWLLAFAATCSPLLVTPVRGAHLIPPRICAVWMLMAVFLQLHAKLSLGRSFGVVPANRGIKLGGPYRFVRHPMYLGYLMGHVGFLALNPSPWNLGAYALCVATQIPRLMAEERLLSLDPLYREYQFRVRYRLIPGVF